MSQADLFRAKLIRNFNQVPLSKGDGPAAFGGEGARIAHGSAAQQLGMSIDVLQPGQRGCPYHAHHVQEEMFIVLEGRGSLRVAGEMLDIGPGDVAFIPAGPEWPHQIVNSSSAPLKYLSISTMQSPELVEYPDSQKYLMTATVAGQRHGFARMHRADTDLDYWDGET